MKPLSFVFISKAVTLDHSHELPSLTDKLWSFASSSAASEPLVVDSLCFAPTPAKFRLSPPLLNRDGPTVALEEIIYLHNNTGEKASPTGTLPSAVYAQFKKNVDASTAIPANSRLFASFPPTHEYASVYRPRSANHFLHNNTDGAAEYAEVEAELPERYSGSSPSGRFIVPVHQILENNDSS